MDKPSELENLCIDGCPVPATTKDYSPERMRQEWSDVEASATNEMPERKNNWPLVPKGQYPSQDVDAPSIGTRRRPDPDMYRRVPE